MIFQMNIPEQNHSAYRVFYLTTFYTKGRQKISICHDLYQRTVIDICRNTKSGIKKVKICKRIGGKKLNLFKENRCFFRVFVGAFQ